MVVYDYSRDVSISDTMYGLPVVITLHLYRSDVA